MIKKPLNRNPRSKGVKVKHVLQICVLVAVCFWLIYQVKHSHDKKKELDENDAKVSVKGENDDVSLKLGRKDISRVGDIRKGEQRVEEEEEENIAEEDTKQDEEASKHEEEEQEERQKPDEETEEVSKHDEEEQEEEDEKHGEKEPEEEENRNEDVEDESREGGGGDDEIDQNEQEKDAGEVDRGDLLDEEKEREEQRDEKEIEENEGREENENASNDQNHEAREENYKADDASSAVSHDASVENSTEKEASRKEETDGQENRLLLKSEVEKQAEGGSLSTNTTAIENDIEINRAPPNATMVTDSSNLPSNNLTEGSTGSANKLLEVNPGTSGAATTLVSAESQNKTGAGVTTGENSNQQLTEQEHVNNSNQNQTGANIEVSTETGNADLVAKESSNSTMEETNKSNTTAEEGSNSESSAAKGTTDATQNEYSEGDLASTGTDESSGLSSNNETVDENQQDPIDSTDSTLHQEERDSRVDLSTLPDSSSEVNSHEDAAAE